MLQKLKIAILGYGHIGKKHADMVAQSEDCELVALIDPKFITDDYAGLKTPPYFLSLQEFLDSDIKVDIVAVCTPNGLHYEQATLLVEHGIHVIIEKPISL